MLTVHVAISVVPEKVDDFIAATLANAQASRLEPGIAQFDLLRRLDEPYAFVLVEVYRDEQAPVRHKETAHYQLWASTVAPMMASPRQSQKFTSAEIQ